VCREDWRIQILHGIQPLCLITRFGEGIGYRAKFVPNDIDLEAFCDVFVQVLRVAGESGLVKLGNIATDGTQLQGNASRHKAMSYGYMKKEVERLREEIEALVTQAYQQDAEDEAALGSRRGMSCRPNWPAVRSAWQRLRVR
jgi:hypothetical protein